MNQSQFKIVYDGVDAWYPQPANAIAVVHRLKVFSKITGAILFDVPCSNDSVASNAWKPTAGCPPGTYTIGRPEANDPNQPSTDDNDWVGEGLWFIPVSGIPGHDGIGLHGGGTCAEPNELNPQQGWCPTENCFRLQNENLAHLADFINKSAGPDDVIAIEFEVVQA